MGNVNLNYWLTEQDDLDSLDVGGDTFGGDLDGSVQPAADFPQTPEADAELEQSEEDPGDLDSAEDLDDLDDPENPDMPEEEDGPADFETWRSEFITQVLDDEDPEVLLQSLLMVREKMTLSSSQRKFLDDNWEIQRLRTDPVFRDGSKMFFKKISETFDKNSPSASYVAALADVFAAYPTMRAVMYKLTGYSGMKVELHRKFIAALLGAVQISSNPESSQLITGDKDTRASITTRMATVFGECPIGTWSLKTDDVERFLSESEQERLQFGSPEERDVLLRRVVMESLTSWFSERSFLIHFVVEDGNIYGCGLALDTAVKSAYAEGNIVIKTMLSNNTQAVLTPDGIIPVQDISIKYMSDSGNVSPDGTPIKVEKSFLEYNGGAVFLTADLPTLQEISGRLSGTEMAETIYSGNPHELELWKRAVFSVHDLISRTI